MWTRPRSPSLSLQANLDRLWNRLLRVWLLQECTKTRRLDRTHGRSIHFLWSPTATIDPFLKAFGVVFHFRAESKEVRHVIRLVGLREHDGEPRARVARAARAEFRGSVALHGDALRDAPFAYQSSSHKLRHKLANRKFMIVYIPDSLKVSTGRLAQSRWSRGGSLLWWSG